MLRIIQYFSIFAEMCYWRGEYGESINENITKISEAIDHIRINAYTWTKRVIDLVRDKHNELLYANTIYTHMRFRKYTF